jgi:hypothetical protein
MRSPGFEFLLELERELIELREELLSGSYLPGDYHYFQIYEPKCRTVAAAPFRDRVVHHAIIRVVANQPSEFDVLEFSLGAKLEDHAA